MKILLISGDSNLIEQIKKTDMFSSENIVVFNESNDPLDVMSFAIHNHPTLMIVDDDFLRPISGRIVSSIKNVLTKVSTIFVTSDESYELGREISPLGIQYYAIKPVDVNDMRDLIASLTKIKVSD
jgi:DNA-binding NarL/FixJ family response regulator